MFIICSLKSGSVYSAFRQGKALPVFLLLLLVVVMCVDMYASVYFLYIIKSAIKFLIYQMTQNDTKQERCVIRF